MRFCSRTLLVAVAAVGLTVPSAGAVQASQQTQDRQLTASLGALWKKVFETPAPQNPLTPTGDHCVDLGGIVAPFGAPGTSTLECTIRPETRLFITPFTSECSDREPSPSFGKTPAQRARCVRKLDAGIAVHKVTVDRKAVPAREVETGDLKATLPADNILGDPKLAGQDVRFTAHGWAILIPALTPGVHTITVEADGSYPVPGVVPTRNTTKIIVKPRK